MRPRGKGIVMKKRKLLTRFSRVCAAAMSLMLAAGMALSVPYEVHAAEPDGRFEVKNMSILKGTDGSEAITSVDAGETFRYAFTIGTLEEGSGYPGSTVEITLPEGVKPADGSSTTVGTYNFSTARDVTFSFKCVADGSVSELSEAPSLTIYDSSRRQLVTDLAPADGSYTVLTVNGKVTEYEGTPSVSVQIDADEAYPGDTVKASVTVKGEDYNGGWTKLYAGFPDGFVLKEGSIDGSGVTTAGNDSCYYEMTDLDETARSMVLTLTVPDTAEPGSKLTLNGWCEYFTGTSTPSSDATVSELPTVSDTLTVLEPEEPTEEPSEEPSEEPTDPEEPETPEEPNAVYNVFLRRVDENGATANPNDLARFSASVEVKASSDPMDDVILHFVLPEGFSASDASASDSSNADIDITAHEVTYEIGSMQPGQTRGMTVTAPVPKDIKDGIYEFQTYLTWAGGNESEVTEYRLTVDSDGVVDPDPENPEEPDTGVLTGEPDVDVRFGANNLVEEREFYPGETISYKVLVNVPKGDVPMKDAVLYLYYPADMTASSYDGGSLTHDKDGNEMIKWNLGDVSYNSQESVSRNVSLTVDEGSDAESVTVYARLAYSNPDPDYAESDGSGLTESNHLTATRLVPDADDVTFYLMQENTTDVIHVDSHQYVDYKIYVGNTGRDVLTNLVVTDVIPDDLEVTDINIQDARDAGDYEQNGQTVTFAIDQLKPNTHFTGIITVRLPEFEDDDEAQSWTNQAKLSLDGQKEMTTNKVTMQSGNSNLWIEILQNKDGEGATKDDITVAPGDTIVYTLRVHNDGSGIAEGIKVTQTIPSQLDIDSSLPGGMSVTGNTLTWRVNDMNAGETASASFKVHVPDDLLDGGAQSKSSGANRSARLTTSASLGYTDSSDESRSATSNKLTAVISRSAAPSDNIVSNASDKEAAKKAVNESGVSSEALSKTTMSHMLAYQNTDEIIINTVYTKLTPGVTYNAKVTLINDVGTIIRDVNGNSCTYDTTFTAKAAGGNLPQVSFVVNGKDYVGKKLIGSVAIVNAADAKNTFVSSEADIDNRTVYSATVKGVALESGTVTTSGNGELTSTVKYTNVQTDNNYRAMVVLMDKSTGKPITRSDGKAVMGSFDFRATKSEGTVEVPMTFGQSDVEGRDIVTYVTLYNGDGSVVLAVDQDLSSGSYSGTGLANGQGSVYATAQTGQAGGVLPYVLGGCAALFAAAAAAFAVLKRRGVI